MEILIRWAIQNNAVKHYDFSSSSNLYRFTLSGSLTSSISAALINITAKMGCKGKKFF